MSIGLLDSPKVQVLMEEPTDQRLRAFRLNACRKEPWTSEWIHAMLPGKTFWDIGANVGSYSLLAAKLGLRVVAIEPGAENYAMLCRNIELNKLGNVITPIPMAVGNATTLTNIAYSSHVAGAAIHTLGAPDNKLTHHILQITLDDLAGGFALPIPHYVKIDTDGGEVGVLHGGKNLLGHMWCQSLMVEIRTVEEDALRQAMPAIGFEMKTKFDKREGMPLVGECYWLCEKTVVNVDRAEVPEE